MKKTFLTLIFSLVTLFSFGQAPQMHPNFMNRIDFSQYEIVDSLPIERIMVHFEKEIDNEDFIDLGSGDYMAPVPHKDNMVVRTNADRTKAIIVHNSYAFGRHFEFNIKDEERRVIYWYQDKRIYCGYIYDKKYKVCKYFESKKEMNRFIRRPIFNRNFPIPNRNEQ